MALYPKPTPRSSLAPRPSNHRQSALHGIEGGWDPEAFVKKAADKVRENPDSQPLWFFRAVRHIEAGRLDYVYAFNAIQEAARLGGASDTEVRSAWFHALGNARMFRNEPPELRVLDGGAR